LKTILSLFLFFSVSLQAQTQSYTLSGKVTDERKNPIEFATISIAETNYTTYTDAAGNYRLTVKELPQASLVLKVTTVGKETQTRQLNVAEFEIPQQFFLRDLSLSLNNVTVTSQRKKSDISNSSIIFDRQTLDQMQAFSLADVLNNLPGKATAAPNLQYKQNITLRTAATGDPVQSAINSMGVAIFIDGIRQSNDANMQNRNIGVWGAQGSTVSNNRDPITGNTSYDTPLSGLDIRNIPVDNIESIEVASGVISAKYGELTDGAIFITRKAGRTDYSANVRLNGSSTNASLSKGFLLGKKAGAVNFNINYLNSIQSPTDNLKNYSRFNGGLMWTTAISKTIKNTFSADYSYKIDNAKQDPDDGSQRSMYSKERKTGLTNRTSLQLNQGWLNRINLALSYDQGYQETYKQLYQNGAPLPVGDKDTTGIYEGYYIPGNFFSVDHIIGKPYNASANLDFSGSLQTGNLTHEISYGASTYLSGNSGQGIIADPSQPFKNIPSGTYLSERPYDFDLIRDILNFGFYGEDRVKFKFLKRDLSLNAGLRYDLQNGAASFQPRINASYQLSRRWSLRAGYGISSKAPSMAYRYPGPTYVDVPILNIYNGSVNESLYLVYTRKVVQDNVDLKPSRSSQMEFGVSADYGFFNTSLYGYIKRNRDGFNSNKVFQPLYLPEYDYTLVPGGKPIYQPNGKTKLYATLEYNKVDNNARSDNYGVEWFVSTKKIERLQTSFNFNTSVAYTKSSNLGNTLRAVGDGYIQNGSKAWYGIYPAQNSKNLDIMSKLSSDTHIPKLGFVVSLSLDVFWRNTTESIGQSTYPIGYLDKDVNYFPISNFNPNDPELGFLLLSPEATRKLTDPPFVYTNLSLRVAKEIRKKYRISVFAYNFLNTEIDYYNVVNNSYKKYNSPVNVGAELSIKF
jgi:ferric enterobactin receptor